VRRNSTACGLRRRGFILILTVIACIILAGCGSNGMNQTISMCYLSGEGYTLSFDKFKIKDAENKDEAIAQVLNDIADESQRGTARALLPQDVIINGATVSDDVVTVDFSEGYLQMDKVREVSVRAGIVITLSQIDGISGVKFTVCGSPVTDSDGVEIGEMNSDLFVDNSGRNDIIQADDSESESLEENDSSSGEE
jgi:germination protein M